MRRFLINEELKEMKKINAILIFIISSFLTGCVKPFVAKVDRYANLLVVDGGITDGPGPYTVKLSTSGDVKQFSLLNPLPNCQVKVKDNIGNEYSFNEAEAGVYKSDSITFRGVPGRSYQLLVLTKDGEQIESAMELLTTGLKIESIDAKVEHKADPDLFYGKDGYQFYLNSETFDTKDNYFLWRIQTTYKFNADYGIHSVINKSGEYKPMLYGDTLRTCYRDVTVLQILLLNAGNLNTTKINNYPLYYEDNYTKALTIRYSLNVQQYKINEAAFTYWNEIKKITDTGGDLYSTQPYQVKNNLRNKSHEEIPVLGYFMVAGIAEKRIFLNRPSIVFRYDMCRPGEPQRFVIERMLNRPDLWPVYFAATDVGMYLLDQECVNCLLEGTQKKPSFWIE